MVEFDPSNPLSDEEFKKLSITDKKNYNRQKSAHESQMRIDNIMSSEEENATSTTSANIEEPKTSEPIIQKEIIHRPVDEKTEEALKVPESKDIRPKTNKVGRPSAEPYTKMSINVPTECVDLIKTAANIYCKGNVSSYIASLIEKDIEQNKEQYNNVLKMMK